MKTSRGITAVLIAKLRGTWGGAKGGQEVGQLFESSETRRKRRRKKKDIFDFYYYILLEEEEGEEEDYIFNLHPNG